MFSGDKSYDEPAWGTFDANDDIDSVWGFNAGGSTKVSRKLYFIIDHSISTMLLTLITPSTFFP